MSDLVERLLDPKNDEGFALRVDAANHIEKLEALLIEARTAVLGLTITLEVDDDRND